MGWIWFEGSAGITWWVGFRTLENRAGIVEGGSLSGLLVRCETLSYLKNCSFLSLSSRVVLVCSDRRRLTYWFMESVLSAS